MTRFLFRLLLLLLALALPGEVLAADGNAPKSGSGILVVDVQRILDESLAAKSVNKQLESQRAKFQTEIGKEENGLSEAEQDLNHARDKLTPNAYTDREQQLRQRFLTVERRVQARRKVLDQAFNDSMNTVRASLQSTVNDVAHERGASLVLTKQQVVWTDKTLDVTDEVLHRLDTALPQVTVKMEPEEKTEQPAN